MEDHRFDALTRSMASGGSRRSMLKGLLGLGAAVASVRGTEAARRPTPTPKPVRCPGNQSWDGASCVCPDGQTACGPECCTPGVSVCCDNACCTGTCHGEEICCPTVTILCGDSCIAGDCCVDEDCGPNGTCTLETHTCVCIPDCEGSTCGSDGCGGTCGDCPRDQICNGGACECISGHLCNADCQECCEAAHCSEKYGGDTECWRCAPNHCRADGGFCSNGVCGFSTDDVLGHCLECGKWSPTNPDRCNASTPCCSGYFCDFVYVDEGFCQPDIG
jgi:hypothetical protein